MDFKKLTSQAKGFGEIAKKELDKRGGTDALKAGAKDVVAATKGSGSLTDKAKAAAAAAQKAAAKPAPRPGDSAR
jgi:hypothetical protein